LYQVGISLYFKSNLCLEKLKGWASILVLLVKYYYEDENRVRLEVNVASMGRREMCLRLFGKLKGNRRLAIQAHNAEY